MDISDQRGLWMDVSAYRLDCIILAGSYGIVWIVSGDTGFYALTGLLLAGWNGWTGWDVGGTGVVWTDIIRRQNASVTIGS